MRELPTSFVLSKRPREYLKQGLSHCGTYCVKAILSAFGLDDKKHPKEYHTNWIGRSLFSFATGKRYYDKIFASYGIRTETNTAKHLSNEEKLKLLNTILREDSPVMIRIGNGYISDQYNSVLGKIIPHWITLWGYDDGKGIFYVYDSGLPKKYWNSNLPTGNTTRTYREILRDWDFGTWQPWCWNTSMNSYLYVRVWA